MLFLVTHFYSNKGKVIFGWLRINWIPINNDAVNGGNNTRSAEMTLANRGEWNAINQSTYLAKVVHIYVNNRRNTVKANRFGNDSRLVNVSSMISKDAGSDILLKWSSRAMFRKRVVQWALSIPGFSPRLREEGEGSPDLCKFPDVVRTLSPPECVIGPPSTGVVRMTVRKV